MSVDDLATTLDELEGLVDRRAPAKQLAPRLEALLAKMPSGSPHRPRALRLMGVVRNRLKLYRDALADLSEAKAAAIAQANDAELARIGRETAVVYAWRGDDRTAALELLHALALAHLGGDQEEIARILAELARIELEARRFDSAARLLRRFVSDAKLNCLPPQEASRLAINLCQALNRSGAHAEALDRASQLASALGADDKRLRFLAYLEAARASAGLGDAQAARDSLKRARELFPQAVGKAFEDAEYCEAEAELQLSQGDAGAVANLEAVADEFAEQELVVRAANVRLALAAALFKAGQPEGARDVLALALRSALGADRLELADRIRSEMIKSEGADRIAELSEDVEAIAGRSGLKRRFILLTRLGQGGFSVVHRALDLTDGQQVALKRLDLGKVYSPERRKQVMASVGTEYAVALNLVHPGIARVRDVLMEPDGTIYIVQHFIDGPSLRTLYASGGEPAELLRLLAEVAEALAFMHGKGVVHRDVKPENVVVHEGRPVLIDFGVASLSGRKDALAQMGTEGYVAPEQARGETVDGRADIYALGKMIAEVWGNAAAPKSGPKSGPLRLFGHGPQSDAMPRPIGRMVQQMLEQDPKHRLNDLALVAATLRGQG
jgi:hypothetical protein